MLATGTVAAAGTLGILIPPIAVMGVIIFIYFMGGFFMDSMALVVVTIPIFFPIVLKLGFDPIWFGVIIVLVAEMGVITPPVGVNVFVIKGITPDIPFVSSSGGIFPYDSTPIFSLISSRKALLSIFSAFVNGMASMNSIRSGS